ncbi:hypothetical protein, partial [Escherichia coli]|uniref:hypothetical protein n=1 Tax=Escherichia coli TaxID=562 RepID=UPI001BFC8AC0
GYEKSEKQRAALQLGLWLVKKKCKYVKSMMFECYLLFLCHINNFVGDDVRFFLITDVYRDRQNTTG